MNKSEFTEVGYIKDAHGIRGEVFVRLFTKDPDWLGDYSILYLLKNAEMKSFKIKSIKPHKDGYLFVLPDVTNRNQSEELKGWTVMLPSEELVSSEEDDEFYLGEVIGFKVIDKTLGELGEILKFHYNGAQDLIVIERNGREVEIPLVEPFIVELNFKERKIEMDLPPGLIEDAN